MNILIALNSEQTSAANDLLADYNKSQDKPLSLEEYFQTVLIGVIDGKVKSNFDASVKSLVAMAAAAPYEKRMDLIQLVQSQLE